MCLPKMFLFLNFVFAMYAGSMLVTSTSIFIEPPKWPSLGTLYEVTRWYMLAAGIYLAALVCFALYAVYPRSTCLLKWYLFGMLILVCTEVAYVAWTVVEHLEFINKLFDSFTKEDAGESQAQVCILGSTLVVLVLLQLTAVILSAVLHKNQYSRRPPNNTVSSDRGWKNTDEYRYHAGGQGTTCPRSSRQLTGELWASSAPPAYNPHSSSQDVLIGHN